MARSKLNDEAQKSIVGAIEAGCYAKVAAEAAGITEACYYAWLKRGQTELDRVAEGSGRKIKEAERPYVEFLESVTRAQGTGEVSAVQTIEKAAKAGDWKAAAWMLERRFSARWANTQRLEVMLEKEMDAVLGVLEAALEPDDFRRAASAIAGIGGGEGG